MDAAALEARVTHLERKLAELEQRENQLLRAVPEAKEDAGEGELLPRRALLTGAAYTLGAVGLSLVGTPRAEATPGYMRYGLYNDAGTDQTTLVSTAVSIATLSVRNEFVGQESLGGAVNAFSVSGHAIRALVANTNSYGDGLLAEAAGYGHSVFALKKSDFGNGVYAYQSSSSSSDAAIFGETEGAGPGLCGRSAGSGNGVLGELTDPRHTQSAVLGRTEGIGAAIEGQSILGRGGVFKGKKAQIRLVASSATNKPSTGTRGDLFVDSSGRLWYCKTGGSTSGWVQLA